MGQYFVIANLKKKEFLHPDSFEEGAKLREFGSGGRTMYALTQLLSTNGTGKGFIGSWCGDPIGIYGDYAASDIYERCRDEGDYINISYDVMKELIAHDYVFRMMFDDLSMPYMPGVHVRSIRASDGLPSIDLLQHHEQEREDEENPQDHLQHDVDARRHLTSPGIHRIVSSWRR